MSERSQRRRAFLALHPLCCFCGGTTPAEEPDHVPSRVFFSTRQAPEGFEFPACVRCNRATRDDEQIVAMLSRMGPDKVTPEERAEVKERIRAVGYNYPEILMEISPTVAQIRQGARKYGLAPEPGKTYKDIPVFSVKGPLINKAVEAFSRKLFCALYYKHTSTILPASGGVAFNWFSNLQIEAEQIPRELAPLLDRLPKVERSRKDLADQFYYRWGMEATGADAGFLVFFRRSFAILGHVGIEVSDLPSNAAILRPYDWA